MLRFLRINISILVVSLFAGCLTNLIAEPDLYIRTNQVGFLPGDIKTGIILSGKSLETKKFEVINAANNKVEFSSVITGNLGRYGNFPFTYEIDFSKIVVIGKYYISVEGIRSYEFRVSYKAYTGIADQLLEFFKVQRCGYTDPELHKVCHRFDATSLIDGKKTINEKVDLTGGWHDAGDYTKFLNTTAYSTYMLLFAYEFDPVKFGFDNNKNGAPDILEEAKVGLDWLLRANYSKYELVTQVQDLRDHDVGWRLPENDVLANDRPAFIGIGKNLIGIYCAAMSLAARIWRDKFNYPGYAEKCLTAAENLYSIRKSVPDIDSSGTGSYIDNRFYGKMALGAVELYLTTNRAEFLRDAKVYADSAGSDYWWSWGNFNSLADYRLAKFDIKYADYIKNNLTAFEKNRNEDIFGKGTSLSWGTNNTLLGITVQNILWQRLTGDGSFNKVALYQRDYILGRNPWGVSFIYKTGTNYSINFHHQVSYFNGGNLPGGFAAGPATREFLKVQNSL